ncbi:glycosyltransferase [Helicobacter heilmannii]|uniref:Type 1 capsular polysaccharide biosynthesis protein J (CapJ) n=2 Tax=Helicobacter heilmannii TaxID=35817 RepID=A0A0K2Y7G7_HELHE|nr:glycosyltransferase [Helicobacter heilmannii]BDQ27815.1 glycosyl transferase family 1 [Helicobacter heilmannii]GMB94940.1 Type 1 capsular polysaccharide biosynthesis protein J CapJ [Helicobacter heilmannii]CRI33644.1 type 1 capsular polysaccharide biosynthesis protein J (capJ) [Helicobacter heilmannii]
MIVALVVDSFEDKSNGTSMTCYRFYQALKARGHEVRVVAPFVQGEGFYGLQERYIPLVTEISQKQHMIFGKPDKEILAQAFEGVDIVHVFLPFQLEKAAVEVAKKLKIPFVGAFHLQPEHITYNVKLQNLGWLNRLIFWWFKHNYYKHIHHIHCPSPLIKAELERHGYAGKKYVISNGFDPLYTKRPHNTKTDHLHHLIMIGRYSNEKNQQVLIEAVRLSRYAENIKLHLKGIGPNLAKLQKCADGLAHPVDFGFLEPRDLLALLYQCDLYIHTADVEGEAIACLEAMSCGIVPIISDSKISATNQFALDNRSLFKSNDPKNLAQKIDYWLEHPQERKEAENAYAASAQNYTLEDSINKALAMYEEVIADFKSIYGA